MTEQYDKDTKMTPSALYMKGMALKKLNKKTEAIATFKDILKDWPHADEAQATSQLHSMGVTTLTTSSRKPSPTH